MKYKLELIVFLSGAGVMVLELVGARVLAPYLGTSSFIWTALIGIVLASLSIGYTIGGKIADKKPNFQSFSKVLFISAILVGLSTVFQLPVLDVIQNTFNDLRVAAVLASIILFAPPSIFLGMVSPYAVRLKMHDVKHSGATVGKLYALSTLGSITGTFSAGFYLIPTFGNTVIFYSITALLFVLGFLAYFPKKKANLKVLASLLLLTSVVFSNSVVEAYYLPKDLIDINTSYNRVWIYDDENSYNRPVRKMSLNKSSSSAMFIDDPSELVYGYTKYYDLFSHFNPEAKDTLMLGGAAYSYPKHFLKKYPQKTIDVVEIDPGLTDLAKQYFDLKEDPNMNIYHEDARTFIKYSDKKYDAIFGDAYKAYFSIPFHLTTKEALEEVYNALNDDGVFIVNIISALDGPKSKVLHSELKTMQEVFPQIRVYANSSRSNKDLVQNTVIVAFKNEMEIEQGSEDILLNRLLGTEVEVIPDPSLPTLTDEYAPVDKFIMDMLFSKEEK